MHRQLALLAIFCGNVAGQSSLTVVLHGERLPNEIFRAMQRESQAAVEPAGVHLIWKDRSSGEVEGLVAVVKLRGRCGSIAPIHAVPPGGLAEPLAQTHVVNGEILPFADLLCDAVHRLVDRDLRGLRSTEREELLGRAYGRVLAHEMYHILLRSTEHGNHGLGRWEQSSSELLAPADSFAASDERRIAESVSGDAGGAGR